MFASSIIELNIFGKIYYAHREIVNKYLVTADVNEDNFTDIHTYTLDIPNITDTIGNNIVSIMYNPACSNPVFRDDENAMIYVMFIDKYFKDTTIINNFVRRQTIIKALDKMTYWLECQSCLSDDVPDAIVMSGRKLGGVYADMQYYAGKTKSKINKKPIVICVEGKDQFTATLLELLYNKGINIYEPILEQLKVTKDELAYYKIDIDSLPRTFIDQ